jgi:UTP:GlnB (protein PII) uridylyltransferase
MLAKALGYKDSPHTLAVEQMMQRYYRTVLKQSRMNEMLLQLFDEGRRQSIAMALPTVSAHRPPHPA